MAREVVWRSDRARGGRALASATACVAVIALAWLFAGSAGAGEGRERPSVLVIMTDDQPLAASNARYMPRTHAALRDGGTAFRHAFATPPICCPARIGFLTGQYAHNHGVTANHYGLFEQHENVLPAWLGQEGYRTAFFGKFVNGYISSEGDVPAPGWDEWLKLTHSAPDFRGVHAHYDYEAVIGTERRSFGSRPAEYSSRMITNQAREFVSGLDPEEHFFAWVSHWAPHEASDPSRACPGYSPKPPSDIAVERFRGERAPRTPAFNRTTREQPPYLRREPRLTARQVRGIDRRWRCLLAAIRAIDRTNHSLFEELRAAGRWEDTLVIFISDNGLPWGEYRQLRGKTVLVDSVARVPLMMRLPESLRTPRTPAASHDAVSQVDLAPTILHVAGGAPCVDGGDERSCRRLDGRSLLALARGADPGWTADRAIPFSMDHQCGAYDAFRTRRWSYLETRADAECGRDHELYDLGADPHQLRNLFERPRARRARQNASRRLGRLMRCTGIEGRDERRPGTSHCE